MSEDSYKGESPGKKLARGLYWLSVAELMGARFQGASHVVLASRHGGDIDCVRALGGDVSRIVAVDRCATAAAACRERHPDADVVHDDVIRVLESRGPFDHVFLDTCSPLGRETTDLFLRAMMLAPADGFVSFAILKGREHDAPESGARGVQLNRRERRALGKRVPSVLTKWLGDSEVIAGSSGAYRESLAAVLDRNGRGKRSSHMARVAMFDAAAGPIAVRRKLAYRSFITVEYHSRTEGSAGVPMMIRGTHLLSLTEGRRLLDVPPHIYSVSASDEDLRKTALRLVPTLGTRAISQLLSIDESSVVAWKAHATRGTYDRGAA